MIYHTITLGKPGRGLQFNLMTLPIGETQRCTLISLGLSHHQRGC
jgi:hypothetical protein